MTNPICVKWSQITFQKPFLALGWPPSWQLLVITQEYMLDIVENKMHLKSQPLKFIPSLKYH